MTSQIIGWLSSFVLVLTLVSQNWKQWRSGSIEGVSKWLWIGQTAASVGFTIYSALVRDWVFVTTNSLLVVNAVVGFAIVRHHRRRAEAEQRDMARSG